MAILLDVNGERYSRTSSLPSISAFTLMGWFKPVNFAASHGYLRFGDTTGPSFWRYYSLSSHITTGEIALYNGNADSAAGVALTAGAWVHLAIVVAGTGTGQFTGYVNGALNLTHDGWFANTATRIWIGQDDDANNVANHHIAAIKIYGAALTAAEIATEMWQYVPVRWANLNAYYPMLEPTGAATDYSFANLALTVAGTPTLVEGPPILWRSRRRGTSVRVPAGAGPLSITTATIGSTVTLTAPTVAPAAVALTGATIATTATITPPTVAAGAVTLTGATVAPAATLAPPTVAPGAVGLTTATLASSATLAAPTVSAGALSLTTATLASTATLAAPTVAPGAVTLTGATLASTATLAAPTAALDYHLSSTAVVSPPGVAAGVADQALTGATVASTATLTAPTVAAGPVTVTTATLASTATLAAPTVAPGAVTLTTATVSSTAALNPPTVTAGANALALPAIASTATLAAPTVSPGAVTLTTGTLASSAVLSPPTVTAAGNALVLPTVPSTAVVRVPTVAAGPVGLTTAFLSSTATLTAPTVARTITTGTIASTALVRVPALTFTITTATIASTAVLTPPAILPAAMTLGLPTIPATSVVRVPSLFQMGPPLIDGMRWTQTVITRPSGTILATSQPALASLAVTYAGLGTITITLPEHPYVYADSY